MSSPYANGKYAFGFCDRTGFRYPLKDLVFEVRNGVKTGLRVGRDVVDPDQPQNFWGAYGYLIRNHCVIQGQTGA